MPIHALCATCKTRPAVQATRPLRCRQCLAGSCANCGQRPREPGQDWCTTCRIVGKSLHPPLAQPARPRTRRRAMRDWQRPIERG